MANDKTQAADTEATVIPVTDESTPAVDFAAVLAQAPEVETPDPEHPIPVVVHVAVSEGENSIKVDPEPVEPAPRFPYRITELGLQPVALASRTFASEFGPGGAPHHYATLVDGPDGTILATHEVKFQNGALGEGGDINGISDSTLLSILADRWAAFQAGPFASEQTGKALECIQQAAVWLNARTAEREARGVQGKHEA